MNTTYHNTVLIQDKLIWVKRQLTCVLQQKAEVESFALIGAPRGPSVWHSSRSYHLACISATYTCLRVGLLCSGIIQNDRWESCQTWKVMPSSNSSGIIFNNDLARLLKCILFVWCIPICAWSWKNKCLNPPPPPTHTHKISTFQ